ncbi:hypothetical protein [Methylopila sp. M107]|uniref:hypothetical protein n=1 Tax=Methylopila sp. M107 TaxID=1101190 RepID=UPI00037674C2|nr:hypothetical protein [Methylopila sp. M107]
MTGGSARSAGFDVSGLRDILRARFPSYGARVDFADAFDLGIDHVQMATLGRPGRADKVLAICAALALDPLTLRPLDAAVPRFEGRLFWKGFGCGLTLVRMVNGHAQRRVERLAGVPLATVCRAEMGRPIEIHGYVALCAYAQRHPHLWSVTQATLDAIATLGATSASEKAAQRIAAAKAEIARLIGSTVSRGTQ